MRGCSCQSSIRHQAKGYQPKSQQFPLPRFFDRSAMFVVSKRVAPRCPDMPLALDPSSLLWIRQAADRSSRASSLLFGATIAPRNICLARGFSPFTVAPDSPPGSNPHAGFTPKVSVPQPSSSSQPAAPQKRTLPRGLLVSGTLPTESGSGDFVFFDIQRAGSSPQYGLHRPHTASKEAALQGLRQRRTGVVSQLLDLAHGIDT